CISTLDHHSYVLLLNLQYILYPCSLFFYCSLHPRALHSFPTRRSSDLLRKLPKGASSSKSFPTISRSLNRKIGRSPARRSRKSTDRKSTRLNSSHLVISYAVFCLKKKKKKHKYTYK